MKNQGSGVGGAQDWLAGKWWILVGQQVSPLAGPLDIKAQAVTAFILMYICVLTLIIYPRTLRDVRGGRWEGEEGVVSFI